MRPPRPPRGAAAASPAGPLTEASGILEISPEGWGLLRVAPTWQASGSDLYLPVELARRYGLRSGQQLVARGRPASGGQKRAPVVEVVSVGGKPPEEARLVAPWERLTAEAPTRRLRMEHPEGSKSARAIDLLAPLGRGSRGLIIAAPFSGKTRFLAEIAASISANAPEVEMFVLLIDERPEEVTAFRRAGAGQVIASSYDSSPEDHLRLAELAMERAQRLVEEGRDVAILIDSLTRLTRASNNTTKGSGRTLSGGLDPAAVRFPRRLFGAARATAEAGSLTILATVLVDTESRLDELIFQEFKGTGNWELKLDRSLAEQRLFPAIDVPRCGTRMEELLYTPEELDSVHRLRRALRSHGGDAAGQLRLLLGWMDQKKTNESLVRAAAKLAPVG
jgi:transcription termination factor Rho